ncbi:hypothetical protein PIB30_090139, partial [Stylosanthes scabra]|nr:hypothetical protein [Stylosanthes scabra]
MVVEAQVPLLECSMKGANEDYSASVVNENCEMKKQWNQKLQSPSGENLVSAEEVWTDGLICAFEFIKGVRDVAKKKRFEGRKFSRNGYIDSTPTLLDQSGIAGLDDGLDDYHQSPNQFLGKEGHHRSYWRPIGWSRISELVQAVQVDDGWASQLHDFTDDEIDVAVADVATPYWEKPVGPTWWCHLDASHPFVVTWLGSSHWLHPAISIALKDETRLISDRMKHLLYEGSASNINVLGILEVQELLAAGGTNIPHTIHEVVAHLACHLARWDD